MNNIIIKDVDGGGSPIRTNYLQGGNGKGQKGPEM